MTSPKTPPSYGEKIRGLVREGYGSIAETGCCTPSGAAKSGAGSKPSGGCCGPTSTLNAGDLAEKLGYGADEIRLLPEGANLGLSCGNPAAIAALRPGEVVLDLGSGGGFDVFLAGPKVGAAGRVIGVDMTPQMLAKARANIESYCRRTGLDNVEFRLGEIEHLPAADGTADVVISNCVINLSPDKPEVWREIARVLRPGGRAAVSDMALLRPLPAGVAEDVEALIGCIAGAVLVDEYRRMIEEAGLVEVILKPKPEYVAALADSCDPLYQKVAARLPAGTTVADFITSLDVSARRPAALHPADCRPAERRS